VAYRGRASVRPPDSETGLCVPIPDVGVLEIRPEQGAVLSPGDGRWLDLLMQHVSEDIKRIRLRQKLQKQAEQDMLTGVYNRRHLLDAVRTEGARAVRNGQHLAFVMIDINGFKTVNDRLGHHVGDRILGEVGQFLLRHVREYVVVIRYEFLLMLPEEAAEAGAIVERIRQAFCAWAAKSSWITVPLSLAAGIARWNPEEPLTWERAIRESDRAMYEDKKAR
jgi:diguanylate cyclase (GGDEF)-like protein